MPSNKHGASDPGKGASAFTDFKDAPGSIWVPGTTHLLLLHRMGREPQRPERGQTRANGWKLKPDNFRLEIRHPLLTVWVINKLPWAAGDAPARRGFTSGLVPSWQPLYPSQAKAGGNPWVRTVQELRPADLVVPAGCWEQDPVQLPGMTWRWLTHHRALPWRRLQDSWLLLLPALTWV